MANKSSNRSRSVPTHLLVGFASLFLLQFLLIASVLVGTVAIGLFGIQASWLLAGREVAAAQGALVGGFLTAEGFL